MIHVIVKDWQIQEIGTCGALSKFSEEHVANFLKPHQLF